MPTGALCPCTSSAMAKPTATAVARLPRSGLPLRSGTRSRKGKVAPLPAEGKRREGTARSERGWGKVASVRRGLKARDRCPAGSGGVAVREGVLPRARAAVSQKDQGATPPSKGVGQVFNNGGTATETQVRLRSPCCLFLQPEVTKEKHGRGSSNTSPKPSRCTAAPCLSK